MDVLSDEQIKSIAISQKKSMGLEDAYRLAESHLDDLQLEKIEYMPGYDTIDKNNSFFS